MTKNWKESSNDGKMVFSKQSFGIQVFPNEKPSMSENSFLQEQQQGKVESAVCSQKTLSEGKEILPLLLPPLCSPSSSLHWQRRKRFQLWQGPEFPVPRQHEPTVVAPARIWRLQSCHHAEVEILGSRARCTTAGLRVGAVEDGGILGLQSEEEAVWRRQWRAKAGAARRARERREKERASANGVNGHSLVHHM